MHEARSESGAAQKGDAQEATPVATPDATVLMMDRPGECTSRPAGLAGQVSDRYTENITRGAELWAAVRGAPSVRILLNLPDEFGGFCGGQVSDRCTENITSGAELWAAVRGVPSVRILLNLQDEFRRILRLGPVEASPGNRRPSARRRQPVPRRRLLRRAP